MKVISTTDLSDHSNDKCVIYKSVSLVEEFGMYNILTAEKVIGCGEREQMYLKGCTTCDFDKAKYMYKREGGIIEEWHVII